MTTASMVCQYSYDLSQIVVSLLGQAMEALYGKGIVSLQSVGYDAIRFQSRLATKSNAVVCFAVSSELASLCDESLTSLPKFVRVTSTGSLINHFRDTQGISLQSSTSQPAPSVSAPIPSNYEATLATLQGQIKALEDYIQEQALAAPTQGISSGHSPKIEELQTALEDAQAALKSKSSEQADTFDQLLQATRKIVELEERITILDTSSGTSSDIVALRKRLAEIEASPLSKVHSSFSSPGAFLKIPLGKVPASSPNTYFVYSGSDGSLKYSYQVMKTLSEELAASGSVLVLDVSTESILDYVFGVNDLKEGAAWLSSPSTYQLSDYVSDTSLSNVQALSVGNVYFNDAFLFRVDWTAVLSALHKDFDSILVFVGPISTMVGRILCNSFSNISQPYIVTGGLVSQLRSLILHLQGIEARPTLLIRGFNPSSSVQQFYQYLAQTYSVRRVEDAKSPLLRR